MILRLQTIPDQLDRMMVETLVQQTRHGFQASSVVYEIPDPKSGSTTLMASPLVVTVNDKNEAVAIATNWHKNHVKDWGGFWQHYEAA